MFLVLYAQTIHSVVIRFYARGSYKFPVLMESYTLKAIDSREKKWHQENSP